MKTRFTIVCLVLLVLTSGELSAQKETIITWDYSGMSFSDFAKKVESGSGLKFYFLDDWVTGLTMGDYNVDMTLGQLLDNLFRNRELYYFIDNSGNVVITKGFAVKIPGRNIKLLPFPLIHMRPNCMSVRAMKFRINI